MRRQAHPGPDGRLTAFAPSERNRALIGNRSTIMHIGGWLRSLGLEQYGAA